MQEEESILGEMSMAARPVWCSRFRMSLTENGVEVTGLANMMAAAAAGKSHEASSDVEQDGHTQTMAACTAHLLSAASAPLCLTIRHTEEGPPPLIGHRRPADVIGQRDSSPNIDIHTLYTSTTGTRLITAPSLINLVFYTAHLPGSSIISLSLFPELIIMGIGDHDITPLR